MAEAHWHPKREARRFEPPPWEREQFEALQKRTDPAEESFPAEGERIALADEAEAMMPPVTPAAKPAPAPRMPPVHEARVEAMLIQLGAEEPRVDQHLRIVGTLSSALAMFFGLCMFVWGALAFAKSRGEIAAVVGAMIVLGMGLVFGIMGLWFGIRVTRGQGD